MQINPRVSVVIPAWNSENQLKQNLASVMIAAQNVGAEIIVVDDCSEKDNTVSYIESLGNQIKLIKNARNLGFAQTVNIGVGASKSDIVVLLNTDVRPEPDCIFNSLKLFESDDVFAVTFNSDKSWAGGWWEDGLLVHRPLKSLPSHSSLWASGGQAAFDRRKWIELGGMDLIYAPFYWEDVDLGYRAWKRGWCILFDPRSRVVHDHQLSVIRSTFSTEYVQSVASRNQLLFVWKNITDHTLLMSHLKYLPRFIKNYPRAFFAALVRLPLALRGRAVERRASVITDREVLSNWE